MAFIFHRRDSALQELKREVQRSSGKKQQQQQPSHFPTGEAEWGAL